MPYFLEKRSFWRFFKNDENKNILNNAQLSSRIFSETKLAKNLNKKCLSHTSKPSKTEKNEKNEKLQQHNKKSHETH